MYRPGLNPALKRFIFVILLLAIPVWPTRGQTPQSEAPPIQWPRSRKYDVQHYRLELAFDWEKKSVTGRTAITLRPFTSDVKEIEIDAGRMTIHEVTLDQGAPLSFRYEKEEKLYVSLDRAYPAGQDLTLTISYTAIPTDGMQFVMPNETEPDRPQQIWTAGQPQSNHYWFPCYDYPNDRASAEVIARVENEYTVISNGQLVSVTSNPEHNTRTWHWKLDQPFPSYLISIAVGQYAEIKDQYKNMPVISYVYPNQIEEGRLSFAKLAQMVEFYSKKFDYDYPYAKYAQVMVRGFPGALENISATTMTDNAVRDRRALLDSSSDGIVSHELAHQWFGDLMTCRDWGEIWLNESLASFLADVWTEHDKGHDDYLYEMYRNQKAYFQAWARGNKRPIVTKRYNDPFDVFDTHAYPHGAAVLNTLRFVLGEEAFWKAIRHYLRKYAWQSVETAQLIIAIEEVTGQNLQWFFDEWVYKMGHPEFEITSIYDEAQKTVTLSVKQTQRPDETRTWFQSPAVITTPVDIGITTAAGETIHRVWIDEREETFPFTVDSKPLIINFDRGNYLIKEVKSDRSDEDLAYQLLHDNDVMGRVQAAVELKVHRSDVAAAALFESARRDPFWGVRLEAVQSLSELKTEVARKSLLEAVKDDEARIRRTAVQGLGEFKDQNLAGLFIDLINTDQSYQVVAEAARALSDTGSPRAYDTLVGLMRQDSWQDVIRNGALDGMGRLKDPRALDLAFQFASPGNPVNVRRSALGLLAEIGQNNSGTLSVLTAALKEGVKNRSLQLGMGAIQALGALGDPGAIPVLEEAGRASDLPGFVRQSISRAITRLKAQREKLEGSNR